MRKLALLLMAAACMTLEALDKGYAEDSYIPQMLAVLPVNSPSFTQDQLQNICKLPFLNMSEDEAHKLISIGANGDYSDCAVTALKLIGRMGTYEYWGAVYRLTASDVVDGSPVPQTYENMAAAVFVHKTLFDEKYKLLISVGIDEPNAELFDMPRIVKSPDGYILHLPVQSTGTYNMDNSLYYHWHEKAWHLLDVKAWEDDLVKKYPLDHHPWIMIDTWPKLETLTVENGIWRQSDAHCCPTGGSFKAQLGIVSERFVVKHVTFMAPRNQLEDQVK